MGRAPCCDKTKVKRGLWSPEEDATLKNYLAEHGTGGNWIALPSKAGLNRCGKSCRLRWLNYLRPDIKHGDFTEEEDNIICTLYSNMGSRWSLIASKLPGRTDNDVKNHWNTKLKKKLLARKIGASRSNNDNMTNRPTNSSSDYNNNDSNLAQYEPEMSSFQDINSCSLPPLMKMGNYQHYFDERGLMLLDQTQLISFPSLMEAPDFALNGCNGYNTSSSSSSSSSQAVSSLSTWNLEKNYYTWSGEFGLNQSPFELLNHDSGFQEKCSDQTAPYLGINPPVYY